MDNFSLCSHRGSCSAEAEGCRINGIFVVGPAKVSVVHRAQLFASEVMADWDNQFRMEHKNHLFLYLSTIVGSFASGSVRFFIILREDSFQSIKGLELSWTFFSVQL